VPRCSDVIDKRGVVHLSLIKCSLALCQEIAALLGLASKPPEAEPQHSMTDAEQAANNERSKLAWRADRRLQAAKVAHEEGRYSEARRIYTEAATLYSDAMHLPGTLPATSALEALATSAVTAAERLCKSMGTVFAGPDDQSAQQAAPPQPVRAAPSGPRAVPGAETAPSSATSRAVPKLAPPPKSGVAQLTEDEIRALQQTSRVNGRVFLPWVPKDASEHFGGPPASFRDPDGPLKLADKQRVLFNKCVRPRELAHDVRVIKALSSRSITQTVVSDCSFVSSLAIAADFERRFQSPLISSLIYPQDASGSPVVSPSGKYMVRLHINGVWRKVIIDDTLPVSATGQLLCSYSSVQGELWVSLLEKAYLKVMGTLTFNADQAFLNLPFIHPCT